MYFTHDQRLPLSLANTSCSDPRPVLPQVLRKSYGPECDIWSCGVILYILLSGVPPFWGQSEKEIFDAILKVSREGTVGLNVGPYQSSLVKKKALRQRLSQCGLNVRGRAMNAWVNHEFV